MAIRPRPTSRAAAFTAVEMLGATALAAVLMLAVLSVLASVGRTRVSIAAKDTGDPWSPTFRALLRRDVEQARDVRAEGGSLVLTTLAMLDPTTGQTLARPCKVVYRVAGIGSTQWLLREQTDLSTGPLTVAQAAIGGAGAAPCVELVCPNAVAIGWAGRTDARPAHLTVRPANPKLVVLDEVFFLE